MCIASRVQSLLSLGLFLALVLLNSSFADTGSNSDLSPTPAPTNAVQDSNKSWVAIGNAAPGQPTEEARYAALLDAYKNLVLSGIRDGIISNEWVSTKSDSKLFIIDQDHPNPQLLAWITCSKLVDEAKEKDRVRVKIKSPQASELSSRLPAMRATTSKDIDSDGLAEVISIGYDGSIYIQKVTSNGPQLIALSPSLASFELLETPGISRVRALLPSSLGSIEKAGPHQVRLVLEIESLESVNGQLLGRTTEQREVIVPLGNFKKNIHFTLEDPPDFAYLLDPQIELRGKSLSSTPITSLDIMQNGVFAWSSPPNIALSALQFNLQRTLESGWNLFRLSATNKEGTTQKRDIWLHSKTSLQVTQPVKKRALIIALDRGLDKENLLSSLGAKGFAAENVRILQNSETSPEEVVAAVSQSKECKELLIYLEAPSLLGMLIDGKKLRVGKGTLSSTELKEAIDAGGYQKVLGIIYSEPERYARIENKNDTWSDTVSFLERLSDGGHLFLANLESNASSLRSQRSGSRERLLNAIKAGAENDITFLVDSKEPGNSVFRGWMFGRPILGAEADAAPSE